MKRSLILSLCAVALAAIGMSTAQATVNVALNLNYTDPADPNEGGSWTLVAQTDTASSAGITGLVVRLLDMPAAGVVNGSIGHDINGGALAIATFGLETEFVYGQNPDPNSSVPGLVANVGLVAGPSNQGTDPLLNSVWDNASVIATGTIANLSTRPSFASAAANEDIAGTITAATIGLTNVRGDSLNTLGIESPAGAGLIAGDSDRDGFVGPADFTSVLVNFDVTNTTRDWIDGDSDSDNVVGPADFTAVLVNFDVTGAGFTPPAIGAVPEPSTLVLLAAAGLGLVFRRRV